MNLQNKKNKKIREFNVIMSVVRHDKEYIVYEDETKSCLYAGVKVDNSLMPLEDEEYKEIINLIEEMDL